MLTSDQEVILRTYTNLMDEARKRLSWIDHIISGKAGLDPVIAKECAYSQIRLTCELVALGCLVAHGDIPETKTPKLQKLWSAPTIISELGKLHPDFFPNPRTLKLVRPGQWHFDHVAHDYLTKDRLLELYGRAGDALHRGHLKNILSGASVPTPDLVGVKSDFDALLGLLLIHEMSLSNGDRFVCQLNNADGKVQALLATRNP